MKCNKCGYIVCYDDECESCQEMIVTGECFSCNKTTKCTNCNEEIEKFKSPRNGLYQYFCNIKCHEKWSRCA